MSEIRIEKGCAGELPDILDFANYVFSQSSQPHDFRRLLPKLYGENSGSEGYHYLVREDGRIRAMVCAMPLSLLVAGKPLRAAGIGTVSVHPYARGKGYMKALMNRAMEDLKTQGYAMAFLGGMRQRYEYFGFTPTGTRASFHLTAGNLAHRYPGLSGEGVSLSPLEEPSSPWCREAYALYQLQPINGARTLQNFCTVGRSWDADLLAVTADGAFAGYVSAVRGHVQELALTDCARLPQIGAALMKRQKTDALHIDLPLFETDTAGWLADVAEYGTIGTDHKYRIFDFPGVTQAYLWCREAMGPLAEGRLVLDIPGECRMKIEVASGRACVETTEETPDLTLSPFEASRFLFSPMGGFVQTPAGKVPAGWFPLPLFVSAVDAC